ncbi:MAG: hypothetical protein KBT67_00370 [bacterium]|nr:hypothetical protein [Candidatus Limimorpha caballi]
MEIEEIGYCLQFVLLLCEMFKDLKNLIFSVFGFTGNDTTPKQVNVEVKPKPVVFKSLYLLGDSFYTFHYDAKPQDFATWLKKNHVEWYKSHSDFAKDLSKLNFKDFVEKVYELALPSDDKAVLLDYLRKWYVQEHGLFRFISIENVFVPLTNSHLLQVLYDVPDAEVAVIDAPDKIQGVLTSLEDYKNNWFIGTNCTDPLTLAIVKHLVDGADLQRVHYKLINDEKVKNKGFVDLLAKRGITNYMEPDFKNVTTIPNDKVTIDRLNRYDQFNDFAVVAEGKFKALLAESPSAKRFDDIYMLHVWNDKQHPKNNVTYVNVGFGSRPLIVSHNNRGFTSTLEDGARLCFYRMETGFVTVSLYPAKTDNRKPFEDCIIIEESIDPKELTKDSVLQELWKCLISYMECTSVDGNPSIWQKRNVKRLRYKRHTVVENVFQETKRSVFWNKVKMFVLTVGFSGVIVFGLQIMWEVFMSSKTEIRNRTEFYQHIDSLNNDTNKAVMQSTDSISSAIKALKPIEVVPVEANKKK